MLRITRDHVTGDHSPNNPPAARCADGQTVVFETRDCYNDCLMADGSMTDPTDQKDYGNPATGPLYVEGAKKGDVLKVEILAIRLAPTALMRTAPKYGAFQHNVTQRLTRQYDTTGHSFQFNDSLRLPLRPMIGVIGTAPEVDSVTTDTPREHGGNMDCKKIIEGSTLYLPVFVDGALLSMGDLHGLMGDGEVMICGLEAAGEVTVRVSVVRDFWLPTPCLRQGGRFMTIQSAKTLDEASLTASRQMQEYLVRHTSVDEYDAARLLSLTGDLAICQIVDPLLTVRMELDEAIVSSLGGMLP